MLLNLIFSSLLPASELNTSTIDPKKLLLHIENLHRANASFAELQMKITTPKWTRDLQIQSWSLGQKYTLLRILSPKKDRGITTLRRGKEMWNYFPKIKRAMKVPPAMMSGSWMGSDFNNDDLVKQSDMVKEYNIKLETQ